MLHPASSKPPRTPSDSARLPISCCKRRGIPAFRAWSNYHFLEYPDYERRKLTHINLISLFSFAYHPRSFCLTVIASVLMMVAGVCAQAETPPSPTQEHSTIAQPAGPDKPGETAPETKYTRYSDTGVYHIQNDTPGKANQETEGCIIQRGDTVTVYAKHLTSWMSDPVLKEHFPKNAKIDDLVLFLDDVPLKGVHPEQSFAVPEEDSEDAPQVHYLRFTLRRTEISKDAWAKILSHPQFSRRVKVSVGFENGTEMTTYVLPNAKVSENECVFIVIPPLSFWLGVLIILGALAVFIHLARWTDIVRETDAPRRPDKCFPYSLSRMQMAFWFFLVIGAFFFLWVIIGDTDTLNSSVLGLIGISAGTALGAAFANSAKPPAADAESDLPAVNLSQPRPKIRIEIGRLIAAAKAELKLIEVDRAQIDPAAEEKLAANADAQAKKTQQITDLQRQLDYFQWPAWKGLMYDLLAENNAVAFHRFQIFIWTIVLGIMFVANVYNELAMPQFSATLLGLLGISAGTYVGFKIPETNKTKAPG